MDFKKFWEDNCLDSPLFEDAAQAVWESAQGELRTQLAACQAHNVELREALKWQVLATCHAAHDDASQVTEHQVVLAKEALSRTTDTEALDAAIAKAVEVEHEACKQDCRVVMASYPLTGHAAADCIKNIGRRSITSKG